MEDYDVALQGIACSLTRYVHLRLCGARMDNRTIEGLLMLSRQLCVCYLICVLNSPSAVAQETAVRWWEPYSGVEATSGTLAVVFFTR